jgi:Cdc6-like AAA superfamily ATPase
LKDEERQKNNQNIAEWLSPTDYTSEQRDFFSRRLDGTGEWLLDSNEFQTWRNTSNQTLLCPGIPGAGKTIISSVVVQHLLNRFRNNTDFGIAYVYCNYRKHRDHTPEELFSSLLRQLFQQHLAPPTNIKALYNHHKGRKSHPSLDELQDALYLIIRSFSSQVFIIIDALDECHSSAHGRERLFSEILDMQKKAPINLFATSRPIPEILSRFEDFERKVVVANEADVLRYINGQIPRLLNRKISKYPELPETVRKAVVAAMDGMYIRFSSYIVIDAC